MGLNLYISKIVQIQTGLWTIQRKACTYYFQNQTNWLSSSSRFTQPKFNLNMQMFDFTSILYMKFVILNMLVVYNRSTHGTGSFIVWVIIQNNRWKWGYKDGITYAVLLLSSFAYKNLYVQHVHQLQKKKLSRSPNICFIPCKQIKNMHGFTKYN